MFGGFAIFGILFVGFGIWQFINYSQKVKSYKKAKTEYERKRTQLLNQLNS